MAECDQRLQQYLQQLEDRSHGAGLPEEKRKERLRKKKKGNAPQFDLRAELLRMTGTDLTQIDGVDVTTTMTILSEAGWDMSKWKTEHHFVSWLRLCPDNRISGDKIIGKGRLPTNNRVTNALRMAASTLRLSNTYLGPQFRRLRTKLGAPVAIKAMAAKLARLVYRMLRYGMPFIDRGAKFYDAQHRKLQINYLKRKAANLGFQIIEAPAPHGAGAHPDDEPVASGGTERRSPLQEEAVAGSGAKTVGGVPASSVGEPATARSAGVAGSTEPDDRRTESGDRARSGEVSCGPALDDPSRSGCADGTGVRADHRESGSVSVWQADRELSGTGAVGGLERESAATGTYHETRELTITFPAGGSGASDGAQPSGMAQ